MPSYNGVVAIRLIASSPTVTITAREVQDLYPARQKEPQLAILGDEPEALLLSVLFAEGGTPNYLVGPFPEGNKSRGNGSAIEEALWLLSVHRRSGMVALKGDYVELPLHDIKTLIFSAHLTDHQKSSRLETRIRNIARTISPGTELVFTGLCRPGYTSTTIAPLVENQSGLRIGPELSLNYAPLFWAGEGIQEFQEKAKVVSGLKGTISPSFLEEFLRVFPTLSQAHTIELAEAVGLFSALCRDVTNALSLVLANLSEMHRVDWNDVRSLCSGSEPTLSARHSRTLGRETVGTAIALASSASSSASIADSRLLRATHAINEGYQAHVLRLIREALGRCGQGLRRSRVAILGVEGLVMNSWSKPESLPLVHALSRKGVRVSVYPGNNTIHDWTRLVGGHAQIEHNLMRAVERANCAVIALPKLQSSQVDASQLALEMNRPAAICDLTGVLEASNVERVGLIYSSVERGTLGT